MRSSGPMPRRGAALAQHVIAAPVLVRPLEDVRVGRVLHDGKEAPVARRVRADRAGIDLGEGVGLSTSACEPAPLRARSSAPRRPARARPGGGTRAGARSSARCPAASRAPPRDGRTPGGRPPSIGPSPGRPAVALHVGDLAAEEIHHPLHALIGRDLHLQMSLSSVRGSATAAAAVRSPAGGDTPSTVTLRALPEDGDRGLFEYLRHRGLGEALLGHDARRVERDEDLLALEPDRRVLEDGAEL